MGKVTLHITNEPEFNQAFRPEHPFQKWKQATLNKLKETVENDGPADTIFVDIPSVSDGSVFEFLHQMGDDTYYTFFTRIGGIYK